MGRVPILSAVGLVTLLGLLAGCLKAPVQADEFTAENAKALIPEAAGAPSEVFQDLATRVSGPNLHPVNGDSLTWAVMIYATAPVMPKDETWFRFLGTTINPSKIASIFLGPKDKDGNFRKYATLIHPEYITDCTCKVNGDTATGTVSFKAEEEYEGKAEYTARKKDGQWRIEEFCMPGLRISVYLGADGKWDKK